MSRRITLFGVVACLFLQCMASCAVTQSGQTGKKSLPVEVLMSGNQCLPAPETWTAFWISSQDQLRQMVSRCRANRIGVSSKEMPEVNFERFGILAVEMGQKSSTGYGFEAEKVTAYMDDRTVIVELEYYEPKQGLFKAQMVTAPWILIRLPAGDYQNIRVVDQDSRILTRIDF